jgi:hypothetical protein
MNDILLEPVGNIFSEKVITLFPDLTNIHLLGVTNFKAIIIAHLCDDLNIDVEKEIPFTVSP